MTWLETLRTSAEAVRTHRLRSLLTVLGITVGVAAVALTFGLGQGARDRVSAEIRSLGTNLLTVAPGSATSTRGVQGGLGTAKTLTEPDAQALGHHVVAPDVVSVAPVAQATVALSAGRATWKAPVVGTTTSWLRARNRSLAEGRFVSREDVAGHGAVAVLGPTVAAQLFTGADPLGKTMQIGTVPVTVIGVLTPAGAASTSAASTQDDQVLVPLTTAVQRLFFTTSLSSILVEARSSALLSAAYQEVDAELLALHGTSPQAPGFTISTAQSLVSTASSVNKTLTALLAGIAGIALLVGGIGVMNIMLMSVTERIREIGLRKALGATPRLIRRQFLGEAVMLGLAGGVSGLLVAGVGSAVLAGPLGDPIHLSAQATAAALGVAVAIGLLFGVFPATRAARLAPIDALRSE